MAHKKAAGSAKNLRDSKPKYRGVKVYGGQPVTAGDIIIRQKGDSYKLGASVYKSKDFTIHAAKDGFVRFGKKKYTRFDGKVYLKTFVEVVTDLNTTNNTKEATKTTTSKKSPAENGDLSKKNLSELKEMAKSMGLSGYSSLKKVDLIAFISEAL